MTRIGVVIGRIGGEDGVALETEKWIVVLRRMGHEVRILTGTLEGRVENATVVPELGFDHPSTVWEQEVAFFGADADGDPAPRIRDGAAGIARAITAWIAAEGIETLLVENASALPCHLQLGLAIKNVCEASGLDAVTHDHDFAWERDDRYETPYAGVRQIVDECFPLRLPTVRHAVINLAARDTLRERFCIESVVVPNVMDFDQNYAQKDDYNATLRPDLGVGDEDLLLMQVTRIVRRKGIETAIHLVDRLGIPNLRLVLTGNATDDHNQEYLGELQNLTSELGLHDRVLFAGDRFDNQRKAAADGRKIYSIEDAYAHATACTYFSTYEGFGNAFVEAVLARTPIFVNRYEPVYWPDIGSKGFETVMIENSELTDQAVQAIREVLLDPARQQSMASHNHALGRAHFSYANLEECLDQLFSQPKSS